MFTSPVTESTRQDMKRCSMTLSIHAEEEQEVDIELSQPSPALKKSNSMKNIGLGLPSAFTLSGFSSKTESEDHSGMKGPSPPPAYGPLLPHRHDIPLNTPPTQDLDDTNAYFSQDVDSARELQIRRRQDVYAEVQQRETEERLAAMEQALTEARDSEEAQRKVAARLRRDYEKLQRDYERSEAQAIKENLPDSISSVVSVGTHTRRQRSVKGALVEPTSVSRATRVCLYKVLIISLDVL